MPLRQCPECKSEVYFSGSLSFECKHCGATLKPENDQLKVSREPLLNSEQIIQRAREIRDWSDVPPNEIRKISESIILTTSFFVAGREIETEIDVITAECVFGMNIFFDFFNSVRDVFGGRSGTTQQVLRDARVTALTELRREALIVGADAVIGIDLDYQELSGGGKSGMIMIVASGTAVRLNKA